MSHPIVRPARPEDLDRIVRLEEASFTDPWPRELLAYELTHTGSIVLVASRAEDPSGYAVFRYALDEAELLRLAVAPEERRRGVARALVAGGLERLRAEGVEACFLEVRANNEGAISLYEAIGFHRAGRRRGYYRDGTDALIYGLDL
ncbi:MAG TPA: ribosomal protein S18-alanine N-acetyltransferase [Thermoanaerobaculia bacterium]|nr:ribosomal protein S18-alanine N-acetyltransferase [Thermoanaerobaculia bacterium]